MASAFLRNTRLSVLLAATLFMALGAATPNDVQTTPFKPVASKPDTKLHYKVFRKGKNIGDHYVTFMKQNGAAQIDIQFSIRVKFLGITAFQMDHVAQEFWALEPLELQSLSAVTDRSSGTFRVNVGSLDDGYKIDVNGEETSAEQGFVPTSFTLAGHLFSDETLDIVLLDTLSGTLRPSRIEFKQAMPSKDFQNAVGSVRYYEILRLDTGTITHKIWYDDTQAFLQVGLLTKDGHYVEYRRQASAV